jgi:hypothetical protein
VPPRLSASACWRLGFCCQSGNPKTPSKPGNRHRWRPGQSGNPAGIARSRLEFEEEFYGCLLEQGAADEAASRLWDSARKREPWADQALLQRLAPETKQIKLTQGVDDEPTVDYSRLSDKNSANSRASWNEQKFQLELVRREKARRSLKAFVVQARGTGLANPGAEH